MSTQENISKLKERYDELVRVLPVEVFKEQRHLDSGTAERDYWHYGYFVALQDVLRLLGEEKVK